MCDWKIGDLALCVDDGPIKILSGIKETDERWVANLRKGAIYTITHVVRGNVDETWVGLGDQAARAGGVSTLFRKIKPLTDEERECFLVDLREPAAS